MNTMGTQVKICGITSVEVARACVEAGATAIGLVFYPQSSRYISVEKAAELAASLPPFVQVVGLFLDASMEEINFTLRHVPLTLLQFHGQESVKFCESFNRPYIKSVGLGQPIDILTYIETYQSARGFLLDSNTHGAPGGSGHTFDWTTIPNRIRNSIILAGGLNVTNVAEAIRQIKPYAVDVSSGVEKTRGVKDIALIKAFIQEIKRVDNELKSGN
ncbi:MAG TPA: phosphoribosylanthranilate isomerase [Gammaproteobacteria bacterium]|nr:phosphoribosylanthranilate isomerase [Gammaproteobacteria bacterium]